MRSQRSAALSLWRSWRLPHVRTVCGCWGLQGHVACAGMVQAKLARSEPHVWPDFGGRLHAATITNAPDVVPIPAPHPSPAGAPIPNNIPRGCRTADRSYLPAVAWRPHHQQPTSTAGLASDGCPLHACCYVTALHAACAILPTALQSSCCKRPAACLARTHATHTC